MRVSCMPKKAPDVGPIFESFTADIYTTNRVERGSLAFEVQLACLCCNAEGYVSEGRVELDSLECDGSLFSGQTPNPHARANFFRRSCKHRRRSGLCLFFAESWSFFLPITLLYLVAMASMANKLKDTNDAFKIRDEIGYICVATAVTSGGDIILDGCFFQS